MSFIRPTRGAAAVILAAAALAAVPAGASAATSASPAKHPVVRADVKITKFVVTNAGLRAFGTATAQLAGQEARKQVTFTVAQAANCTILTLSLQQLHLQLLGLDLITSPINLDITGRRSGTLGRLFCSLAGSANLGNTAKAKKAAASLNRYMKGHPLHVVRMRSQVRTPSAQTAQAPAGSCAVLDLILGPLHLDLLGLVVDLYGADKTKPVEVHITGNPAGGILGSLLCGLANTQPPPIPQPTPVG